MILSLLLTALVATGSVASAKLTTKQFYPLTRNGEIPAFEPYKPGQDVFIDCISRNIDTGEHVFDSNERIVYTAFPTCKETDQPLSFHYGVSEDINCTFVFTDEIYHLFQLYVHEDAPFSCRIPLSTAANYLELGGAYIPLTFNLRGEVHNSHLDIDSTMNLAIIKPGSSAPEQQTVVSAVAWSAGTNATRVIIGDSMTLQLAVRWFDNLKTVGGSGASNLPFPDGFYRLPLNFLPISSTQFTISMVLVGLAAAVVSGTFAYKVKKNRGYHSLDRESGLGKRD